MTEGQNYTMTKAASDDARAKNETKYNPAQACCYLIVIRQVAPVI